MDSSHISHWKSSPMEWPGFQQLLAWHRQKDTSLIFPSPEGVSFGIQIQMVSWTYSSTYSQWAQMSTYLAYTWLIPEGLLAQLWCCYTSSMHRCPCHQEGGGGKVQWVGWWDRTASFGQDHNHGSARTDQEQLLFDPTHTHWSELHTFSRTKPHTNKQHGEVTLSSIEDNVLHYPLRGQCWLSKCSAQPLLMQTYLLCEEHFYSLDFGLQRRK